MGELQCFAGNPSAWAICHQINEDLVAFLMSTTAPDERITTYTPVVPTTEFPALFPIFANDDLSVYVDGEERSDFTVTASYVEGVSNNAKVIMNAGVTGSVVIAGERHPRRQNRFLNGGPLPIKDMNLAFDALEGEMQEARRDIDRSMKVNFGQTPPDVSLLAKNVDAANAAAAAAIGAANGQFAFDSRSAAASASIPLIIHSIELRGDAARGDGLGGIFIDTNNGSNDTFVSADGRTWYRGKEASVAADFYLSNKKIDFVAGVLRQNAADRTQWAFINDSTHRPVGFDPDPNFFASDGVTRLNPYTAGVSLLAYWKRRTDALRADVNSGVMYDRILACTVTADERLSYDWGIMLGARVTRTGIVVNGSMHKARHGRIYWNGSDFVSDQDSFHPTGTVTTSYDPAAGTLTVNHGWLPGQDLILVPDTRTGVISTLFIPMRKNVTNTSFELQFMVPNTGGIRTGSPGSGMSFRWTKAYNGPVFFDGSNGWDIIPWSDNGSDDGNIWVYGIMQRQRPMRALPVLCTSLHAHARSFRNSDFA